jgi:hypothetical protein
VYAGIGSAGGAQINLLAKELAQGLFDHLLHRQSVGLPLPA